MRRRGGVSSYLRALRPHLGSNVEYFPVGSRCDRERIGTAALRLANDWWRFALALRRGRHDIVHLNPSIGAKALLRDGVLLLLARAFRKPVIVFAHGWDEACERALSERFRWLFRLVYGGAEAFIVLGSEFQRRLRRLGYGKTIFMQGVPIDDDLLADCQQAPLRRPASAGSQFNILFLARLEREKGIYEALEAYRIVKEKYPFVSLTVAGEGSELARAVAHTCSRKLTDVTFAGHVEAEAKYKVFKVADAYVFPSYTEGLPISVLEAMAYGLPVVTCAVGGLCDFFQHGAMGFITESRNPQVFALLLSRLIEDPALRSRISLFNSKYARDHFTATQVAAGLEGIYRLVLGGSDSALLRAA